jgi:hypothetical protein
MSGVGSNRTASLSLSAEAIMPFKTKQFSMVRLGLSNRASVYKHG